MAAAGTGVAATAVTAEAAAAGLSDVDAVLTGVGADADPVAGLAVAAAGFTSVDVTAALTEAAAGFTCVDGAAALTETAAVACFATALAGRVVDSASKSSTS